MLLFLCYNSIIDLKICQETVKPITAENREKHSAAHIKVLL